MKNLFVIMPFYEVLAFRTLLRLDIHVNLALQKLLGSFVAVSAVVIVLFAEHTVGSLTNGTVKLRFEANFNVRSLKYVRAVWSGAAAKASSSSIH